MKNATEDVQLPERSILALSSLALKVGWLASVFITKYIWNLRFTSGQILQARTICLTSQLPKELPDPT